MSSFSNVNDTQLVSCASRGKEISSSRTQLQFNYSVELDRVATDVPEYLLKEKLPSWVLSAILQTLSSDICDKVDNGCIQSLSIENNTVPVGSCEPTLQASESCFLYSSDIQLLHSNECEPSDLLDSASKALTEVGDAEALVQYVNTKSILNGTGNVTNVDIFMTATKEDNASGGLAPAIAAIIAVLLFILLIVCIFAARYSWTRSRQKKFFDDIVKSVKTDLPMHEEDSTDSCTRTLQFDEDMGEWVNEKSSRRNDDDSANLKLTRSVVDVHMCSSALCPVCRPNLGQGSITDISDAASVRSIPFRINTVDTLQHQEEMPPPTKIDSSQPFGVVDDDIVSFVRVESARSPRKRPASGAPKQLEL